ncbi:interleukin-4 receptor subunit alpha-like [Hyla sarda]|uniref:interleukin-4 receptor subunit alpha-like n=1 Tax=Hyla sarda TaxID=327740 RepID=UPI0024C32A5A|nr:interleukin-4 receptor subunit alpha-like [Hyla sarda]XP_056391377.1 interleukin-4 receptor subunit alpha-like [Hyla sarda]
MKTTSAAGMRTEMIQISWIWITAFIIAPSHSEDIPRIKNLDCVNDFDKKMVCFWEVENGNTNCSSDFQLKYTNFEETLYCQDLDNEYDGNFRVPSKCICNITRTTFIISESFVIEVESQGQSLFNTTINIMSSVKPKPPSNLHVNLTDPEYGVVLWKSNNEGQFIEKWLTYRIQFISKERGKLELEDLIEQLNPQYTFSWRQLTRGLEYRVRVRTKYEGQRKEIWSEWSPEVEFRNDYNLTVMEKMWFIIPALCAIVLLLIVSCYFGIIRIKKRWWNNIPDPARSKLAESNLIPKNLKPAGKPTARKWCGNWLSQLVKAHKKSKYEQFTREHPVNESVTILGKNRKTIIFEPEKVDIESLIHLYPRVEDKVYQEDSPEDKEEDFHLMTTDLSIGRMFCDILCDSSMKVEELEQLNVDDTFGCSILRDHFHKTDRHLPLSMVSQESGYQSYDSDDSPGDSKSDGPNIPYLDHPISQGDFLPYASTSSINKSSSQIEDVFVNSGYNSFANALAEAAFDIMERDNILVFSMDSLNYKPSYNHSLQNPKSILYYNRRCFPYADDLQATMTPTSDHTIDTCPPSVSEVPGYQSFNQAIEQGDTSMCIVFDSGYKPFEYPTHISTNSLDNMEGLSELPIPCPYQDQVKNQEDLPKSGMASGWTDLWNDTQSSDFNLAEFNFFDKKYPFRTGMLGHEHRDSINHAADIHYGINRTLPKADNPLALTFDISDHMRNFANMHGSKTSLGLEFVGLPTDLISFPCSLEEKQIICDDLLDKNCLHTDKDIPMKFENKSYFVPHHYLRARGYSKTESHLLVQKNSIDEEGNLYMKITLLET